MNGPGHYREAERLLRARESYFNGGQTRRVDPPPPQDIAMAQVHATLALVAATAASRVTGPMGEYGAGTTYTEIADEKEWSETTG